MFCTKCGSEIVDAAVICTQCGCPTQNYASSSANQANIEQEPAAGGMIALSIIVPIVGVILGVVKLCEKQNKSGSVYLSCGLISWFISAALIFMVYSML